MASISSSTSAKEIAAEIPTCVRVYKDGTIERLMKTPLTPPSLDDPQIGVSSKDVVISHKYNPSISISARLYLPKSVITQSNNSKLPILVYFHGGGFVLESAFSEIYHAHLNTFVSEVDRVMVVSVDYRLAPEHLLPACYHDAWDALLWVASHSTQNEYPTNTDPWLIDHADFNRVFIGGDSAGANVVHNTLIRAGEETLPGGVKIFGAFLSHPFFYSSEPIGSELVTIKEQGPDYMLLVWSFAFPSAPGGIDCPMINPLAPDAPNLAMLGCSKLLVCVASKDKLRDRGVWYYEAVKNSGWKGELDLYEETQEDHVYHIHNPESENSKKFIKRLASFLLEE